MPVHVEHRPVKTSSIGDWAIVENSTRRIVGRSQTKSDADASARVRNTATEGTVEARFNFDLEIHKIDDEQGVVFAWASVVEEDGVAVIDHEGDVISPEELEKAAFEFVMEVRTGGDMHVQKGVAELCASMVFTDDVQTALGIDIGKVGWLTGWKIRDAAVLEKIKSGERPMMSIHGTGERVPIQVEV